MMESKDAYSVEAFAAKTGIGRTKIFAAIKEGQLRAKKLGRKTLILHEDGRQFLESLPDSRPPETTRQ